MLREDQIHRYARHVLLPDVGGVGQARLLASTVAIDPRDPAERIAFDYCAAAGVGTIALVAPDDALIARARALNPDVRVVVGAEAPRLPRVDDADPWVRAGAAATMLLHRIATTP
jgi:adenylyltransferase/sulfurtransferase